jgi:hypothetical protein
MRKDVLAPFFHKATKEGSPDYEPFPKGDESWCGYQRANATAKNITLTNTPCHAMYLEEIKPINYIFN